jgi:isopenicillin N synthase-like dioxygenase
MPLTTGCFASCGQKYIIFDYPTDSKMSHNALFVAGIPSIDLADFLQGDSERQASFVQELGRAYEEVGFVAVRNHGLSAELCDHLYRVVRGFFGQDPVVKATYEVKGAAGQRGYTRFGQEHAKGRSEGDLKEFFQIGQEVNPGHRMHSAYDANVVVHEPTDFNNVTMLAYRSLEACGQHMLRAIALYLRLPEHYFRDWVDGGTSILRAIHYGPILQDPGDAVRAAEHEDINLITLLMGASAEGLEILSKAGAWVPVTALPDQIVVNVGDMLQRLTNHRLKSTTHRVVNPSRDRWSEPRFSIPFFLHPQPGMPLDALPTCVPAGSHPIDPPITAGDYLDERLREIGLKK